MNLKNKVHEAAMVNGKFVVLLNGNMIEKNFLSMADAEQRAKELTEEAQK